VATPKSKRVKSAAGPKPTSSSSHPIQPRHREEGGKDELAAITVYPKDIDALISKISEIIGSGKTEDLRKTSMNALEAEPSIAQGLRWIRSASAMHRQSLPEALQQTAYGTIVCNTVSEFDIKVSYPIPQGAFLSFSTATDLLVFLSLLARFQSSESQSSEFKMGSPPERHRSVLELASDVLENPGEWLRTQNSQLGDRKPIDLIGTDEEEKVFNLLNAVDQGLF